MSSNSWKLEKSLAEFIGQPKRMKHTLVYYSGSLFLYGGRNSRDEPLSDILRYDLKDHSWQRVVCVGTAPCARFEHTCVVFEKDLVIFGGKHDNRQLNDLFKYHIPKAQWSCAETTKEAPGPRCAHNAAVVDSHMYILGGFGHHVQRGFDVDQIDSKQVRLNDMWRLSLKERPHKWTKVNQKGCKPPPNCNSSMAVNENHLYLLPGAAAENAYELFGFNVLDECWTKLMYSSIFSHLVIGKRVGHSLTASEDSQLFLFGGGDDNNLYRFDINDPHWSVVPTEDSPTKPAEVAYHSSAMHKNTLYIYGGVESPNDVDSQRLSGVLYSITIPGPKSTYITDMKNLWESKKSTDITCKVGPKNTPFECHSSILIGRSSTLRDMIMKAKEKDQNYIELPDIDRAVFDKILQFIYTDTVTPEKEFEFNDLELFMKLYIQATRFNLSKLRSCSLKFLISSVNAHRVVSLLIFADKHDIEYLRDSCMNFLRKSNNYKEVIVKRQIEELSKNLLLQVARLPAETSDEYDSPPKLPELLKFSSIKDDFARLLETGQGSDVKVTFENYTVKAHKAVLCARSEYFTGNFRSFPSDEITVKFKGENTPPDVLKQLLKFLYTDAIDATPQVAVYLLGAAEYFCLSNKRLDTLAWGIIERNLGVNCVFDVMLAAHDVMDQALINKLKKDEVCF